MPQLCGVRHNDSMINKVNMWLQITQPDCINNFQVLRPWIAMRSGLIMSIQASEQHYCEPRKNGPNNYICVELGFPNERIYELDKYASGNPANYRDIVYPHVPAEIVDSVMESHGGVIAALHRIAGKWAWEPMLDTNENAGYNDLVRAMQEWRSNEIQNYA